MFTALLVVGSLVLAFTGGELLHLFLCLVGMMLILGGLALAIGLKEVAGKDPGTTESWFEGGCLQRGSGCLGFILGVVLVIWIIANFPAIHLGIIWIP